MAGVTRKSWNAVDDARLVKLWNESELPLDQIAAQLGHPTMTTYERAHFLGLKAPAPDGWELLTHAALRAGFETDSLRRVLHLYGATVRRALTRPCASTARPGSKYIRLRYIVHPREVDAAVEHYLQTETVTHAAKRIGMSRPALTRRLERAGVKRIRPIGRPPKGARPEWRVTEDDVEKAMAVKMKWRGNQWVGPADAVEHERRAVAA